jgi:ABC-type transporter Mla maintaining outer membrane lipid asymmetry ATPase subunit MlaF
MGRRLDPGIGVLARSAFYARVGLACELFGLVSGASVLDNLMTFLLYHREGPKGDLEARARGILGSLGFGGEAATANCALLGKPQRTLGLVALAIAKDPPLVILERPRHFLGPLFPRAWERLGQMGPKTATLVLALATEPHDDLDFDLRLSLKP